MLKLIGVLLIVMAGGGMGLKKGAELSKELAELQELRRIFLMLRSEIEYTKAPLGEAFYHISRRTSGIYKEWLLTLAEQLKQKNGQSFREVWESVTREKLSCLHLRVIEREQLEYMGANLGFYDREMETGAIELYLEQLKIQIQNMQMEIPAKKRIFRCLGIMGGIFTAVILM